MMSFKQMGICLIAAICLFETANAVRCFQCESKFSPACGESLNIDMLQVVDCSKIARPRYITGNKNSTSCVKMITEDNGKPNIVRSCFFENSLDTKSKCLIDPNSQSVFKSCDLCNTDLCNGSSSLYGSIAFICFSIVLAIKNYMF
ncbi:unnamed protein product [Hermetia illucens]|uniref:Protein sleepless n=1 Tax=Hermetia illucens TaxID=343691 RepID=A0A7R8YPZ0_HERIL|nr:uncharacterized protein LOC119655990 [Hermetia illucens]CAD7079965.1 unnamed protein product [Hermetia illucens]